MTPKLFAISAALLILCSSGLDAQRVAPTAAYSRSDTTITPRGSNGHYRFLGSVGGSLAGVIAGGFLGYQILPHDCGCDDPGLDAMIYGAFAGSIIGSALGAAFPDLHSVCSFNRRFMRSLAGAALAGGASYFVAGGRGSGGTLIAVPLGSVGGSLAALGGCWKSRT